MKLKNLKKLIPAIALIAMLAALSSCNKGYGCPQFSAENVVTEVVELMPGLLLKE